MMEKGIENPTRRVEAVIATLTDPESMLAIEVLQALDERRPEVWEERGIAAGIVDPATGEFAARRYAPGATVTVDAAGRRVAVGRDRPPRGVRGHHDARCRPHSGRAVPAVRLGEGGHARGQRRPAAVGSMSESLRAAVVALAGTVVWWAVVLLLAASP
jgi:hypothetical protein